MSMIFVNLSFHYRGDNEKLLASCEGLFRPDLSAVISRRTVMSTYHPLRGGRSSGGHHSS